MFKNRCLAELSAMISALSIEFFAAHLGIFYKLFTPLLDLSDPLIAAFSYAVTNLNSPLNKGVRTW